jgi:hypothetical protein
MLAVRDSKESPSIAADLTLQKYVRYLLVVDTNNADRPIRIVTLLDFTRYQEFKYVNIEKILDYYRD